MLYVFHYGKKEQAREKCQSVKVPLQKFKERHSDKGKIETDKQTEQTGKIKTRINRRHASLPMMVRKRLVNGREMEGERLGNGTSSRS